MSRNKTRKEKFLEEMERVIPWGTFSEIIDKHYKKTSKVGRPKKELVLMLKIYFLQQWYNLGDEEVEEAIVDSNAFIAFTGLPDYGTHVPCPDSTTILRFRHFLEEHDLRESWLHPQRRHDCRLHHHQGILLHKEQSKEKG